MRRRAGGAIARAENALGDDTKNRTARRPRVARALRGALQIAIAALGLLLASYVGGWLLFVGGLSEVLLLIDSPDTRSARDIAVAVLKLASATPVGGVLFWSAMGLVMGLWETGEPESA